MDSNTIKSTFFSERNASILFSTAYKFIKRSIGYDIGEQGEDTLLMQVMESIYNENPNNSVLALNKKTLDVFSRIVSTKITEIRDRYKPVVGSAVESTSHRVSNEIVPLAIETRDQLVFPELLPSIQEPVVNEIEQESEKLLTEAPEELTEYFDKNKMIQSEFISIDSRERDVNMYPEPNKYRYVLLREYHNVISIELITAEIPTTQYNINVNNNNIYFQETDTQDYLTATIPTGNYTLSQLKSAIETAMNTASVSGAIYSVDITTYALQNKVRLISDLGGSSTLFNLLFNIDNNMGSVLGFSPVLLTNNSSYTSDRVVNLSGEQYVLLKLDNIKNIQGQNKYIQDGFAKISLNTKETNRFFTTNSDYTAIKMFANPVSSLAYLDISFCSYLGLYDFNGMDHSLTLKITYINALNT